MRRWNGWGDDSIDLALPPNGRKLLKEALGAPQPPVDFPRERLLNRVPATRLPDHPLISDDPHLRLDHAHGQSLPDWIGIRYGSLQRFPDGVARPDTVADVEALLQFAKAHDIILIPYGGGTSVVGHLDVPETPRPVLSVSLARLNRLVKLDPKARLAVFEAGVSGPELEQQLTSQGFTLGHFPQSFEYSTLGGWVVTRSSGQQSKHYGRIEQLFAGGDMSTPAGALYLPPFPASAAGPDLRQLVLGSEGRIGILTRAIVRISPIPEIDTIYAWFFPSWEAGQKGLHALAGSGIPVSMVRLSSTRETAVNLALAGHEQEIKWLKRYLQLRGIPAGEACLCLVGFTGTQRSANAAKAETGTIFRGQGALWVGRPIGKAWHKNRFRSAYLRNTLWDSGYAVDTLETAVTWDKVAPAVAAIEAALKTAAEQLNEPILVFSHLSHIYSSGSSIYTTYLFRLSESAEKTLACWKQLKTAASRAIVEAGGTISHQHGVGVDHKPYLGAEKGETGIAALQHCLDYFDPKRRMNPFKLIS